MAGLKAINVSLDARMGSCWAFASNAAAVDRLYINSSSAINIIPAPQRTIDCPCDVVFGHFLAKTVGDHTSYPGIRGGANRFADQDSNSHISHRHVQWVRRWLRRSCIQRFHDAGVHRLRLQGLHGCSPPVHEHVRRRITIAHHVSSLRLWLARF